MARMAIPGCRACTCVVRPWPSWDAAVVVLCIKRGPVAAGAPRSHDGASALPVVLSHLPVYPLNCLTMGRFLTSSTLALLAAAGVQAADVALYGQCGGIGYTGPTTCVAGSFCMHYNDWYCECYRPRELAP